MGLLQLNFSSLSLKYLSLMTLLDLSCMAKYFTKLSLMTLKKIFSLLFKVFEQFY